MKFSQMQAIKCTVFVSCLQLSIAFLPSHLEATWNMSHIPGSEWRSSLRQSKDFRPGQQVACSWSAPTARVLWNTAHKAEGCM